jgi:hypothetical protein
MRLERFAEELYLARRRLKKSDQLTNERRLPRTVRPEEPERGSGFD